MIEASAVSVATFGGGCFWCMVQPFENTPGVMQVVSGYAGGTGTNPTYEDFVKKGHVEVVQVTYNPFIVSYDKLLEVFLRQIDPTDASGQFYDRGPQYRPIIFYHSDAQKRSAEEAIEELKKSGRFTQSIQIEIAAFSTFYPAEQYHQQYYKKSPEHYKAYRSASGRDVFLKKTWDVENKNPELTPLQYDVIKCNATEPPFANEYWNTKEHGIYVDRVSGEVLFSSLDKFDSGSGWPSFTKPVEKKSLVEVLDNSLAVSRMEVRSKKADSHLGHVFTDGPTDKGGLRYCINSAALRFIPLAHLEKEGYAEYLKLFHA